MAIIKGFTQWINEEATATAPAVPAAPAQTYTLKANGITYKYPFMDDAAYLNYSNFGSTDEATMKAALAKIVPSMGTEPVRKPDGSKTAGSYVLDLVKAALELHATFGWKKAAPIEQMLSVPTSPATDSLLKKIKELSSTYLTKERQVEWNKNWPTVWNEQCTKANLVFTAPAAPVVGK